MPHVSSSRARGFQPAFFVALLGAALLLGGCLSTRGPRKTERSSSVVSYLYPDQANPLPPTSIPVLRLPLRVGIAFVPVDILPALKGRDSLCLRGWTQAGFGSRV